MTKKNVLYFVRIIGVLLLITMLVAALLAFVNELTKDRIAEIQRAELENAVKNIFPTVPSPIATELDVTLDDTAFNSLTEVKDKETIVGYYANVSPKGFKGAVNMLIGLTPEGKVCGIQIVESDETPGIGDKIENPDFLAKFNGTDADSLNVDTISGATYSSEAVIEGTKTALAAYAKYKEVA